MESVIQKLQEKGAENMQVSMGDEQDENASNCIGNETPKGKRRGDQRGINKPSVVPTSHPTHHNITNPNRHNSGSKGEECPAMDHGRSKGAPGPKDLRKDKYRKQTQRKSASRRQRQGSLLAHYRLATMS
eukprot:9541783-Ditylum_brightwellii.AAC.1